MKRTIDESLSESLNEIDAFRAQELLLQRATEGLSEAQTAELAALGAEDDYSYDLAATAVDLATVPCYELPSEIAQRVLLAAGARPPRSAAEQPPRRTTRTGTAANEPGAMTGAMTGLMIGTMAGSMTGPMAGSMTGPMAGSMTAPRLPTQQPVAPEAPRTRGASQPPPVASPAMGAGSPATLLGHPAGMPGPGPAGGPHAGYVGHVAPIAAFPPGPPVAALPPGAPVVPLAPRRSRAPMIVAWTAAVAGLAAAAVAVVWATRQEPQIVVQRIEVPAPPPVAPLPTAARARLLATAGDVVTLPWTATTDPAGQGASGDVVWSPSQQEGYLRFVGLAANDPKLLQYQLWIFDKLRDESYPVDGGVFDVGPSGEVVIKISPKLHVNEPLLFAVTIEPPGGVVVSKRERVVVTAAPRAG